MERSKAYADARATETGRRYLVSAMGHAMVDLGDNRRLIETDLGGVAYVARPTAAREAGKVV